MADSKSTPPPKPTTSKVKKHANLQNPRDFVTIVAVDGSETLDFVIHKDFACHYSPVFKAAFNSTFIEGRTQKYKLDDTTKGAVRLLVNWFYTQRLNFPMDLDKALSSYSANLKATYLMLAQLWVLADRLMVPSLQNQVIREFEATRNNHGITPTSPINYIYKKTSPESPLRRWVVKNCACHVPSYWFRKHPGHFPKEMLIDLATLLIDSSHNEDGIDSIPQDVSCFEVAEEE